jgi:hypothetical protein
MANLDVQERLEIQLAISDLVSLADSQVEMGTFLQHFLRQSVLLLEGVGGTIWLLRGDSLDVVLQEGMAAELNGAAAGSVGEIPKRVLQDHKPYVVALGNHAAVDLAPERDYVATYVALDVSNEPLGILQVIKKTGPEQVVYEEEIKLLQNLTRILSLYVTRFRFPRVVGRVGDLSRLFGADREIFSSLDPIEIAYKLANMIPDLVPTDRCTIALFERPGLVVRAISGQDTIDRKSVVVKKLTRLLIQAAVARETLYLSGTSEESFDKVPALRNEVTDYFQLNPFKSLYTFPLLGGKECFGILCIESTKEIPFLGDDRALVELFAQQAAVALRNARAYHSIPMRAPYEKWLAVRAWFGRTPRLKAATYVVALALAVSLPFVIPVEVRISGEAEVTPQFRTFARAKAEGVLKEFRVKEGQPVRAAQVVALLDDEGPRKNLREALARADVHSANITKHLGLGDYAEYEVEKLRLREVELEIELLRDRLEKAQILAETEGIVLTLQPRMIERIGKSVSRGEELLEIGDVSRLVLQVAVPEEDISWVKEGQSIRFILNSAPEKQLEVPVTQIHPKAEATERGNFFLVDGELKGVRDIEFKPGMKGSAKIYAEEKSAAFVFFRRLVNFIRIHVLF